MSFEIVNILKFLIDIKLITINEVWTDDFWRRFESYNTRWKVTNGSK